MRRKDVLQIGKVSMRFISAAVDSRVVQHPDKSITIHRHLRGPSLFATILIAAATGLLSGIGGGLIGHTILVAEGHLVSPRITVGSALLLSCLMAAGLPLKILVMRMSFPRTIRITETEIAVENRHSIVDSMYGCGDCRYWTGRASTAHELLPCFLSEKSLILEGRMGFLKSRCYVLAMGDEAATQCASLLHTFNIAEQYPKRIRRNSPLLVLSGLMIGLIQAVTLTAALPWTSPFGEVSTSIAIAHIIVLGLYGLIVLGAILSCWEPYYCPNGALQPHLFGVFIAMIPVAIFWRISGILHAAAAIITIVAPTLFIIHTQLTTSVNKEQLRSPG